jgi:hypothetical protein
MNQTTAGIQRLSSDVFSRQLEDTKIISCSGVDKMTQAEAHEFFGSQDRRWVSAAIPRVLLRDYATGQPLEINPFKLAFEPIVLKFTEDLGSRDISLDVQLDGDVREIRTIADSIKEIEVPVIGIRCFPKGCYHQDPTKRKQSYDYTNLLRAADYMANREYNKSFKGRSLSTMVMSSGTSL